MDGQEIQTYFFMSLIRRFPSKAQWNAPAYLLEWLLSKKSENRCWQECRQIGTLHPLVGMHKGAAPLANSMALAQKIRITMWFSVYIYRLCVYIYIHIYITVKYIYVFEIWKGFASKTWGNIYTPVFSAALLIIAKRRKQPTCPPVDEPVNKMWYYQYN